MVEERIEIIFSEIIMDIFKVNRKLLDIQRKLLFLQEKVIYKK